jgi:acyl-CoA oxidase
VSTSEALCATLDGRWRAVKNRVRATLSDEKFRPHYTPNTAIARAKVAEQLRIMAGTGVAADSFRKEHGGTGDVGAAVSMIEMLAMSDLSLMVKAGVQWGCSAGPWRTWAPSATTAPTSRRSSTSRCSAASR